MSAAEVRTARRRIRAVAADLRPGIWVKVGPLMWRRLGGAPPPPHLTATKGTRQRRMRRALALATDIRHAFVVAGGRGRAELAVAAFDGGTVLLDVRGGEIIRRYGTGTLSETYLEDRRIFASFVTAPSCTAAADRRSLREPLVAGAHLLAVDVPTRIAAIRTLIDQFAALTAAVGERRTGLRAELDAAVATLPRGAPARRAWESLEIAEIADGAAWVPSAYEATAKNLMVDRHGSPVPIDLGDLAWQPSFAYPVGILVAAGPDVVAGYLAGAFDEPFARLFAAAGAPWPVTAAGRGTLLLVRAVYAALRDERAGHAGGFAASLDARWSELAAGVVPAGTVAR